MYQETPGADACSSAIIQSSRPASPRPPSVPDSGARKRSEVMPKDHSTSRVIAMTYENIPEPTDQPPDGGYGWICVACVTLINAHTWGLNNSFGVFLAYYLKLGRFPSATAFDYALIGGLCESQALLISPLVNFITRRTSTRATLLLGALIQPAALLGASWATRTWHLFLTQGVCFGWALGLLYVASVGLPAQWFARRRSLANGIASSGVGLGGVVYGLATNAMIERLGLAWTFRVLATIAFIVNATVTFLLRDRNAQVGVSLRMFNHRLLWNGDFLLLLGWGILSSMGYLVVLFSLPTYASTVGLSEKQGSILISLLNLSLAFGRPIFGHFSDRYGPLNVAGLLTLASGLLCLVLWILAKTFASLAVFALLGGALCGTYWGTVGPVTVEVLGLRELPPALSMTWFVLAVPCVFAEVIGLQLRSHTGNVFLRSQVFTGSMYLGAALCMWLLRARVVRRMYSPSVTTYLGALRSWRKV